MCYIPLVASRNDATGSDMLGVNWECNRPKTVVIISECVHKPPNFHKLSILTTEESLENGLKYLFCRADRSSVIKIHILMTASSWMNHKIFMTYFEIVGESAEITVIIKIEGE